MAADVDAAAGAGAGAVAEVFAEVDAGAAALTNLGKACGMSGTRRVLVDPATVLEEASPCPAGVL